jgi:TetR/AcrR family fatty acid metabolism transcriptional regulator
VRTKTPRYEKRMLDAAARLFGQRGFHDVRVEDIALEAEVSKGTLYRYFKDKEELYTALLARASRSLVVRLQDAVSQAPGARQRLIAIVRTILTYFDAQPHLFDLIQRAEVRHSRGGPFPWQQVRDEGLRLVLAVFAEGHAQGEFTILDPEQAALMLLGGLRAVIRVGKRPRPRDVADRVIDDFLHGAAH